MGPKSQAGQKRPSEGADIRKYFMPSTGQAQSEPESEPAPKRAKMEAATAESLDESNQEDAPPVAQAGWNNTVGTGLRTSFGTKFNLEKPQPDAEPPSAGPQVDSTLGDKQSSEEKFCKDGSSKEESPKDGVSKEESPEEGDSKEESPKEASTKYESPGSNESIILGGWTIPNSSALSAKVLKKTDLKTGDTWEARLGEWYSAVSASNPGKEGLKEPTVFLDIWSQWLKQQAPMTPSLRGQGLKFTTVESLGAKRINAMIQKSEKNSPGSMLPPEKTSPSWTMPPAVDAASLELLKKVEAAWTRRFVSWLHEFAKLNPGIVPVTKNIESRISDFYVVWLESHNLARKITKLAVRMSRTAFNKQRERLRRILAGLEDSTTALESTDEATVLSSTEAPQSTEEVIALSSSPSEGEICEDDDDTSTPPSPRNKDTPNGTTNTERLPPGPVLFNWDMTADSPSGINGASQIPELPVIPLVAEPIKLMSAQEELEYRANYYPGVLPDDVFCLYCTNHGHATRECPLLTCRWCGVWGHPHLRCPTRHRCTKCRQLGHEGKGCTEKLALTRDEMDCARCGAKDHLENRCYEMFRSTFNPPPERIRKVKALPISCAQCGGEGHYWTECGLNAGWITEADKAGLSSATTRKFYVDPDCDSLAICYANNSGYQIRGAAAANGGRPAHLNGKSIAPKRHVEYYEEDDDDDEQFIRPPPQKRNQPGKITFSSFSSSNNRGRGGGGRYNNGYNNNGNGGRPNPPLPSGPPPSGPRAGSRRGRGGGGRRGGRGGY